MDPEHSLWHDTEHKKARRHSYMTSIIATLSRMLLCWVSLLVWYYECSVNMSVIIPSFIILSVVVPAPDLTHKYNTRLKKLAMNLHSSCFVLSMEYWLKGKAQYGWPTQYVSLFSKKGNNVYNIKSSWSKLVRSRRSTVLSLPLHLGFPVLSISDN